MRLIDADAMKELWQGCEIKGSISPLLDVRPTVDAIIIPDNATNEDMIKALFNIKETPIIVTEDDDGIELKFNKEWWKAPYERGMNNEINRC